MVSQFEIRIYGRVQGVGFRSAARNMARSLKLMGWVSNRIDGSVIAVIKGDADACKRFIAWCRQGTGYSWVERVDIKEVEAVPLGAFSIRY